MWPEALAVARLSTLGVAVAIAAAAGACADEDWPCLILDAKPVLDARYRLETVDQDGKPRDAEAHTLRLRFGVETGRVHGVGAVADAEWIEALAGGFNDTLNGKTAYPVVADPDDFQLNQLYLVADGVIPDTKIRVGRQRIIWDDSRFIGNVGFRQNEQTFDAARVMVTALPDAMLEYVYLDEARRIFGDRSPQGVFGMQGHGARLSYAGLNPLTITPFALLLDFDGDARAGLDSQTYGVNFGASVAAGDGLKLAFAGALATQSDYADNPAGFRHWYLNARPSVTYAGITLGGGVEVLQGDGETAFQTPLATLHKFNGLTDQFLTTPADGLVDWSLSASARAPEISWLNDLTVKANYHWFRAEHGGAHYGTEWDIGLFHAIPTPHGAVDVGLQYASYDAGTFAQDTEKLWLTVHFRLNAGSVGDLLAQ